MLTAYIFERKLGWYWRLEAANGKVVAIGAEPFKTKASARRAVQTLCKLVLRSTDDGIGVRFKTDASR